MNSLFHQPKSKMVEPTCELFNLWKQHDKHDELVRCDNGGENIKLQSHLRSKTWKMNVQFEITERATPQ